MIDLWFKPRLLPFTPVYNLLYARSAKAMTRIPIISVGGFRSGEEIEDALQSGSADLVSLSRPFLAEPDFVLKLRSKPGHRSACINCNYCAVMCDSGEPTKCYKR
jgi:2,4-dienoyl-CoA reductase-like NADH-dependent reductase (Old Yellow Enzyme family)